MGKKVLVGVLSLLLIIAVVFGACAKTTTSTTQTTTSTTQTTSTTKTSTTTQSTTTTAQLKTLKIGALIAMNNAQGVQTKKWYDLYAKLVNDAGGWKIGNDTYNMQVVAYDTQANPTTAKDELTRLVLQDGCKFVFGGTGSAAVDCTITEPNKVIIFGTDMTADSAKPTVNYYYTTGNFFTNALQYKIESDVVKLGVKSYVSVKPDNQTGHFIDMIINSSWKIASPTIKYLGTVYVDPSTVDFGPVATKIMSTNPDCADLNYLGFIPNTVPQTYRALADIGFAGIIFPGIMSPNDLKNIVTMSGKAIVENGEVFSQDPTGYQKDPRMLSFINAYIKEYGQLDMDATSTLNAMFVLEDAMNATQSIDVDVLKAYLDDSPPAVRGTLGWTQLFARPEVGNNRTISGGWGHPVQKITDGKLVNFSQVTLKDQYLFSVISTSYQPGFLDAYKAYWAKYGYPQFPAEEKGMSTLKWSDLGVTGQD
jgi:branched-chain amino acid transport system substrate-binding protein